MEVQSNFYNRNFVVDHKLTMGLRSGECLRQSNTYFCFLKIVFTFSNERHRVSLGVLYYLIEMGKTELLTLPNPDKSAVLL